MPLSCNCYAGCWGRHAIEFGWTKVEFPKDLLKHPKIANARLPSSMLTYLILVPTYFLGNNRDPSFLLEHGTYVSRADGLLIENPDDVKVVLNRIEVLRMELELLNPVPLYLEAHVTIEPVFDERRELAAKIAKKHKFKLADLLMKKERSATEERSDKDTFMTGHSKLYRDLAERTVFLVRELNKEGFKVWRYKIENTICDSRSEDVFGLDLDNDRKSNEVAPEAGSGTGQ